MDRISVLIRRDNEFFFTEGENQGLKPISTELEKGNTLRESLRENVREETGVEVEITDKIDCIEESDYRRHWYLTEEVKPSEENPEPEKIHPDQGEWIKLEHEEKIEENTKKFIEERRQEIKDA